MRCPVVLVTGASSGFGLLTSIALAKQGFYVLAGIRDLSKKGELQEKAAAEGVENNIEYLLLDVTKESDIAQAAEIVENQFGYLDVLINNAGIAVPDFAECLSVGDYRKQFETNVFGVIQMTQAFLPLIRRSKQGRIINVSSISGLAGFPGLSAYTASKHAVEGFSESLFFEVKPFGIDVILIEPGSFATKIWEKSLSFLKNNHPQSGYYQALKERLLSRFMNNAPGMADPGIVVKVLTHAVTVRKPKFRYIIGKNSRLMLIIKRLFPWKIWAALVFKEIEKNR
ncbi:NAD(P)-dependent dehydrogenase (short-subunit alcohol dehydrogenase family) [Scopulibacillus daqui]|uniref:NAD(P)-dependent dehydrogenase (Short-subunit alcohol dehydrogenase family) n=1 Tax=Scopulibacillus daqui TaxID=1469162 RepID=A0ABS2PZR8_9BACL|nr:SDR family oxidoreductase [Scopulibacillus daqui]MBM7645556.1 NAD(P)-dependent dehydrogenase (short-subunit alcohol dehydrogenase family) [Scopulibacillus daqui]